ncbi:hypothetical protein HYZ97_01250 [Candidatus Pacearchaeota archaeon]|nr:hypothetical protein [Candidatus Pacearchaeota archaeon]
MELSSGEIEQVNKSILDMYTGRIEIERLPKEFLPIFERMHKLPVNMALAESIGIDSRLVKLIRANQGIHSSYDKLKCKLNVKLMDLFPGPGFTRLTMLYNGVYVGEPEDFLAYLEDRSEDILYPLEGLGKKVGDVVFIDG